MVWHNQIMPYWIPPPASERHNTSIHFGKENFTVLRWKVQVHAKFEIYNYCTLKKRGVQKLVSSPGMSGSTSKKHQNSIPLLQK